jgi:hypothetical protein
MIDSAKIITVIETKATRGDGKETIIREVVQYWSLEGSPKAILAPVKIPPPILRSEGGFFMKPDEEQSGAKRRLVDWAAGFETAFPQAPLTAAAVGPRYHRHAFRLDTTQFLFCPLCGCVPAALTAETIAHG